MTLVELLANFPAIEWGTRPGLRETVPSAVCMDSRQLAENCVYVAIRGAKVDGHGFLPEAVAKGALALVVEGAAKVPPDFTGAVVRASNTRDALNKLAARFYRHPSKELFCVGVTGTNGKTTTTHIVEAIFNEAGRPAGVIGTNDHHLHAPTGYRSWKTELTTPGPLEFQSRLRDFADLGARALAMEVSNVGLIQNRADEVAFDAAIFTNLTRDHLDIHPDMEDYFSAKRKLFTYLLPGSAKPRKTAIINGDDEYGLRLLADARGAGGVTVWSYGIGDRHDLRIRVAEQGFFGTRFQLETPLGRGDFEVLMPGLHNVYNAAGAIGSALAAGIDLATCARALAKLEGVKGRLEAVPNSRGLHVFVDYAHTDDAIATVLRSLGRIRREAGLKNKIITVFGCGGDRDKGKRPLMMKAAAKASEFVVVTSDNPRTENPEAIIRDALAGADPGELGNRVFAVTDRREGIRKALGLAAKGDVVVIAGKGHEDYQMIGTVKQPFSDVEVVKEILE